MFIIKIYFLKKSTRKQKDYSHSLGILYYMYELYIREMTLYLKVRSYGYACWYTCGEEATRLNELNCKSLNDSTGDF